MNTFQWNLNQTGLRWRKCIWNCHLQNGGLFFLASMCQIYGGQIFKWVAVTTFKIGHQGDMPYCLLVFRWYTKFFFHVAWVWYDWVCMVCAECYVLLMWYDLCSGLRWILVNIVSGNGLLADGNKPLPKPILTYFQWKCNQSSNIFIQENVFESIFLQKWQPFCEGLYALT